MIPDNTINNINEQNTMDNVNIPTNPPPTIPAKKLKLSILSNGTTDPIICDTIVNIRIILNKTNILYSCDLLSSFDFIKA
jgi:hypothetical protein